MSRLRHYQQRFKHGIYDAWRKGAQCVAGVTATGSGKTVVMGDMTRELTESGASVMLEAHRSELVGQISKSLAAEGIRHNIIASSTTVRSILDEHMEEFGRTFYDPSARAHVASVDTILRRQMAGAHKIDYLFQDEGHHTLADNKWGRAVEQFPNPHLRVALFTATLTRADGKGHGRHHDGICDALVIGPGLAELMHEAYLCTYKTYQPSVSDLDLSDVHIGSGGEFNQDELARAVKRSKKIVGDVVKHYGELAAGKQAIVFAVDIEHAQTITDAFNAAGVPAALVHGKSLDKERHDAMKGFKARTLKVLVNVDLFGEGVDVPAVEVVIMARPTASFALYAQQVGRMLRLSISPVLMAAWDTYTVPQRLAHIAASDKPFGILIDHVGNTQREYNVSGLKYAGLPEGFNSWGLDRRQKRKSGQGDAIPQRMCGECFKPYERFYDTCPHCGAVAPPPAERSGPEFVDGKLHLLDPAIVQAMRLAIVERDRPPRIPDNLGPIAVKGILNRHAESQQAQGHLRNAMAAWAGWQRGTQSEIQSRFYLRFNRIDVLTAQALPASEAIKLTEAINADLQEYLK